MNDYTVSVPVDWYTEAVDAMNVLSALQAHGVDNWEGYGDALRCADGKCDTCG